PDQVPHGRGDSGHLLDAAALGAPVDEVRIGGDVLLDALPWIAEPDAHQPIGLRVRQRPQQDAVHDAEDGGGDADAQRHLNITATLVDLLPRTERYACFSVLPKPSMDAFQRSA